MPAKQPPITTLSRADLAKRVEQLAQANTRWRPNQTSDPGWALIQIFARMAEQVIQRLNQMPEKHFRAFLDLIGAQLTPPRPARVPLTFRLAEGAPNRLIVPAATQAMAQPEQVRPVNSGGQAQAAPGAAVPEPIIFETTSDLPLTPAKLVAIYVREPNVDMYADLTPTTIGTAIEQPMFCGNTQMGHQLYLACDVLLAAPEPGEPLLPPLEPRDITLLIHSPDAARLRGLALIWATWHAKEQAWIALTTQPQELNESAPETLTLLLRQFPLPEKIEVDGRKAGWLRATLAQKLPVAEMPEVGHIRFQTAYSDLIPDSAFANQMAIDLSKDCYPLGEQPELGACFYLTHSRLFTRPGALVELRISLSNRRSPQPFYPVLPVKPSPNLRIAWEYWNGRQWRSLMNDAPWNGRPMYGELLVEQPAVVLPGDAITLTGRRPTNHEILIQEQFWNKMEDVDSTVMEGRWEAQLSKLSPGMHAYRIMARRNDEVRRQRWVIVYNAEDQSEPTPVEIIVEPFTAELPKDVYQRRVRVKTATGRPVLLVNAVTGTSVTDTSGPNGEYVGEIDIRPGRNDLLALVYDDKQRAIGGTIAAVILVVDDQGSEVDLARLEGYDGTWGLTRNGTVRFTLPEDAQPALVNGQAGVWVRARIAAGNYGTGAGYEPLRDDDGKPVLDERTKLPMYQFTPASFRPPFIQSVQLSYTSLDRAPDWVLSKNDFVVVDHSAAAQTGTSLFRPFRPSEDKDSTLYLGFDDRLLGNQPVTLYVGIAPNESIPAQFVWEYAGPPTPAEPKHWQPLYLAENETQSFSRSGLVQFIVPSDMTRHNDFDRQLYWLRVIRQLEEPVAAQALDGQRVAGSEAPILDHVLTNTIWAIQGITVRNEILGSSNGEADQRFQASQWPILTDEAFERANLTEDQAAQRRRSTRLEVYERLSEDEHDFLTAAGIRLTRPSDGAFNEYWVEWREVPDFYASHGADRHYTLSRLTGEVGFGNGIYGMRPRQGRANIRLAEYHWGGGLRGNVGPNTITRLTTTLPYVAGVSNYVAASGGADAESIERLEERGPKWLRHRDRAVTNEDFADLAFEASPEVARAIVINPQAANYNPQGQVRLVILPVSRAARPEPSPQLIRRVEDYLAQRRSAAGDLRVGGMALDEWVPVGITAVIVPTASPAASLEETIVAALQHFLHPLTGGFERQGWNVGQQPHKSDIYKLLEEITGVDHVESLTISPAEYPAFFLICSGQHTIDLSQTPEEDPHAATRA